MKLTQNWGARTRGSGGALGASLCRNCWRTTTAAPPRPRLLIDLHMARGAAPGPGCSLVACSPPQAGSGEGGDGRAPEQARYGGGDEATGGQRPVVRGDGSGSGGSGSGGGSGGGRRVAGGSTARGVGGKPAGPAGPDAQTAPPAGGGDEAADEPPPSLGVRAALSMLAFYRNVLSPLMPSTCRFLPTCSVYSIESYKKFGVTRGTVLTAWRLLRCNPWGGRGYDPPAWPPVGLGAIYQYPYTPEVTVVLGAALTYWLVASTIESLVY